MIEVNVSFETASSPCIELMDVQDEAASTEGSKRKSTSLKKLKKYFSTSKDQPTSSSKPIDKNGDSMMADASESGTDNGGADKGVSTPLPQSSTTKMVEYLMHIKGKVPSRELDTDIDKKKVNLIIIVDISGSMGGSPIRQVNTSLKKIIDLTENSPHVANRHIMVYNHNAKWMENDMGSDLRAGGSTDFVSVFDKLKELFDKVGETDQGQGLWQPSGLDTTSLQLDKSNPTYILMMTDGCDTVNSKQNIDKAKEKLQVAIESYGGEVVVNVLGFSQQHDDNFLNLLSLIGTSDGSYNFVSPSEGDSALHEILVGMVSNFSTSIGRLMNLEVKSRSIEFLGKWFNESSKEAILVGHMTKHSGDMIHISTHKFVRMPEDQQPEIEIKAAESLYGDAKLETKIVDITKVTWNEAANPDEVRLFQLRKMRAAMNMVSTKISEATSTPDPMAKAVHAKIKSVMEALKNRDDNPEIKRLGDALKAIIFQCDEVLNPKPEMSEDHSRMTRRAMMSTNVYGRSSEMRMQAQVQNIVVLSSAPQLYAGQSRFAKSSRRTKQSRMVHTDYTRGSDSEDSD